MKKKFTLFCILLVFISSLAFSSDYKFLFGALGMHSDYLGGIGPTYLDVGVGKTDLNFLEDNSTELQLYVGGGLEKRTLWNAYDTGINDSESALIVDLIRADWKTRLKQGFFSDVLTASIAYDGIYENFRSISEDLTGGSDIYPDLVGDQNLGNYFTLGLNLNFMDDNMFTQDGFLIDGEIAYAPLLLNNFIGKSDFYSANIEFNFAKTLVHTQAYDTSRNLFSLVLVDRFVANYTDGSAVPTYYRKGISLGRKVRGFSGFSYNNKLTFVNNLDLRVSVFEIDEISFARVFPRFNFFLDVGYGMLDYVNTTVSDNNLLASTGVQATISVSDFADIGYQLAYIFVGDNFDKATSFTTVGTLTLMLDF